jgi:hypothetical protein
MRSESSLLVIAIAAAIVANTKKILLEATVAARGEMTSYATELAGRLGAARGAHPSAATSA